MRISINNIWLTNDGISDLRSWSDAHDVRLNGRQVVQEAQFLRAISVQAFARGNLTNELQFTVTQQHASVAEASAFALTAFSMLPGSGAASIVCGAYGETPVTCTFSAVLEAMPSCTFRGMRTDLTFLLRGGTITTTSNLAAATVDGGAINAAYSYAVGGTLDGGNLADGLVPSALNLDGGTLG